MPELPEVETMCRGIRPVVGYKVRAVEKPRCRCRPISIRPGIAALQRRLVGQSVAGIERLGKRVILRFDNQDRLVIEPRMTGLVLLADPPDVEHLRLAIRFSGDGWQATGDRLRATGNGLETTYHGQSLHFWDRRGLGTVRLVAPDDFERDYGLHRIGPDALAINADELAQRLAASKRAIKVALLDQHAVAGIGNLYAAEILHLARVHPATRCDRIRDMQWDAIHQAIGDVLRLAIRYEGSTLGDGTYRNALNQSGSFQNHHRVYDRADEPCLACGTAIVRIVQAQRSTFFCPECQANRPAGRTSRTCNGRRR